MQSVNSTAPADWAIRRNLTPRQRCSQCILQPQPTGLLGGVLPLRRDAVCEFYSTSRLSNHGNINYIFYKQKFYESWNVCCHQIADDEIILKLAISNSISSLINKRDIYLKLKWLTDVTMSISSWLPFFFSRALSALYFNISKIVISWFYLFYFFILFLLKMELFIFLYI